MRQQGVARHPQALSMLLSGYAAASIGPILEVVAHAVELMMDPFGTLGLLNPCLPPCGCSPGPCAVWRAMSPSACVQELSLPKADGDVKCTPAGGRNSDW